MNKWQNGHKKAQVRTKELLRENQYETTASEKKRRQREKPIIYFQSATEAIGV